MSARLAHILRYPVKSIGGEELAEVSLTAGAPLPGDRRFAVLHAAALQHLDGEDLRRWLPKSAFVRGVAAAPLQAISGGWDGDHLVLSHPARPPLRFDPARDEAALLDWEAVIAVSGPQAARARAAAPTATAAIVRRMPPRVRPGCRVGSVGVRWVLMMMGSSHGQGRAGV